LSSKLNTDNIIKKQKGLYDAACSGSSLWEHEHVPDWNLSRPGRDTARFLVFFVFFDKFTFGPRSSALLQAKARCPLVLVPLLCLEP
jgi:hypothetical protein